MAPAINALLDEFDSEKDILNKACGLSDAALKPRKNRQIAVWALLCIVATKGYDQSIGTLRVELPPNPTAKAYAQDANMPKSEDEV